MSSVILADLPILVFRFLILTFVLNLSNGAFQRSDHLPHSHHVSQEWLCDRVASSDGVLDVSDQQKTKKGRKKVVSSSRCPTPEPPLSPPAPPPKNPIWARPVYVKDKQPAVKSVFSVVRLFATRTQRKGNLVEQTHRVLDLVDDLQAGFSGRHSHSAYIHLHLLKTPGRARPVITGTFPVVVSVWLEGIRCLHYWCGFWFSHVRSL